MRSGVAGVNTENASDEAATEPDGSKRGGEGVPLNATLGEAPSDLTTGDGDSEEDEEADDSHLSRSLDDPDDMDDMEEADDADELIDRRRGSDAATLAYDAGEDGTDSGSSRCRDNGDSTATDDDIASFGRSTADSGVVAINPTAVKTSGE